MNPSTAIAILVGVCVACALSCLASVVLVWWLGRRLVAQMVEQVKAIVVAGPAGTLLAEIASDERDPETAAFVRRLFGVK